MLKVDSSQFATYVIFRRAMEIFEPAINLKLKQSLRVLWPVDWLDRARECVGQKMKPFVLDEPLLWDLYILLSVIHGLATHLSLGEETVGIVGEAIKARWFRDLESHRGSLGIDDIFSAVNSMRSIFRAFQCENPRWEEIATDMSRLASSSTMGASFDCDLSINEMKVLFLHVFFDNEFQATLQETVCACDPKAKGLDWSDPKAKGLDWSECLQHMKTCPIAFGEFEIHPHLEGNRCFSENFSVNECFSLLFCLISC